VRQIVAALTEMPDTALASVLDERTARMFDSVASQHLAVSQRSAQRERAVAAARSSMSCQLVQPGLFDRRSLRRAAARAREDEAARDEMAERLSALDASTSIRPDAHLAAALIVRTR
jgi:hypothetical protein